MIRGLGEGRAGIAARWCGLLLPKRAEPHDRVQGATDLQGSRGGNRRSREERQGRNEHEVGILGPTGGRPPWSGRAVLSRWRGVFGKPQERSSRLTAREDGIFGCRSLGADQRRAACDGERRLYVSEGEAKVTRAACQWHTCSRTFLEGPVVTHQDHGGSAGKANYPQPASR
jgi:hypothetical protein